MAADFPEGYIASSAAPPPAGAAPHRPSLWQQDTGLELHTVKGMETVYGSSGGGTPRSPLSPRPSALPSGAPGGWGSPARPAPIPLPVPSAAAPGAAPGPGKGANKWGSPQHVELHTVKGMDTVREAHEAQAPTGLAPCKGWVGGVVCGIFNCLNRGD